MNKTKINYLTHTWNPIVMRCTPVSAGCKNCWHLRLADRMKNNLKLPARRRSVYEGYGIPYLDCNELEAPLRRRTPAIIGVQFMGDLFHPDIAVSDTDRVMDVIDRTMRHTYIILTKRPGQDKAYTDHYGLLPYNRWLGVSVEDQRTANERIPILLQIPAERRIVSVEPMLEPIDLRPYLATHRRRRELDWVVIGCESGPHRRPCPTDWIADLVCQCGEYDVPVYVKQISIDGKVSYATNAPEFVRQQERRRSRGDIR